MSDKPSTLSSIMALVGYTGIVIIAVLFALIPVANVIYHKGYQAAYKDAVIATALESPELLNQVCYQWWFASEHRLKKAPKK